MKKSIALLCVLVCLTFISAACSPALADKDSIISLYQKNENIFLKAAESGDYSEIEHIQGIQKVLTTDAYVDIQCGGSGFGSSTHYYGIFYSADDNLCAIDVAGPKDKLVQQGNGYSYKEENGNNRYYVESLGHHFYYYEAHF